MADEHSTFTNVRAYAKKFRRNSLEFNSKHLEAAPNAYVAWLDLMGASHIMSTSVHKSANFLARFHMAVERSREAVKFGGQILPINDGVFIVAEKKFDIVSIVGRTMIILATNFIATPRPHDRFLLRGGLAFGPTYFGHLLTKGFRAKKSLKASHFMDTVMFGPALIQAFQAEHGSPPFGIAVHESARAFCPPNETTFRMNHWMWWAPNERCDYPKNAPPLSDLKDCLASDLDDHFSWLESCLIFHGLDKAKIQQWRDACGQYFKLG